MHTTFNLTIGELVALAKTVSQALDNDLGAAIRICTFDNKIAVYGPNGLIMHLDQHAVMPAKQMDSYQEALEMIANENYLIDNNDIYGGDPETAKSITRTLQHDASYLRKIARDALQANQLPATDEPVNDKNGH